MNMFGRFVRLLTGNPIDMTQIGPGDVVVLVVGPSGAGKSEFIHLASQAGEGEIGHGLAPKTKKVKGIKVTPDGSAPSVVLVDTPGINSNLGKQIPDEFSKHQIPIAGVLYLHPLSGPRLNENPITHLDTLRRLCGDISKILFVTTYWQPPNDRKTRNHTEFEAKFKGIFLGVVAFDRTHASAWSIVSKLLPPE